MKVAKRLEMVDAYLGTAMNVILTRMKDEGKDVINQRNFVLRYWMKLRYG